MNLTKTFCLIAVSIFVFAACKKEKLTPAAPSVVGFWQGKYGNGSGYPNAGYAFLFRNDGTVRVYDGSDTTSAGKAEGTYTVIGNTVTTTYFYEGGFQYSTKAVANSQWTFTEGSWGYDTNTTNGGKFFVNKQ